MCRDLLRRGALRSGLQLEGPRARALSIRHRVVPDLLGIRGVQAWTGFSRILEPLGAADESGSRCAGGGNLRENLEAPVRNSAPDGVLRCAPGGSDVDRKST